MNEEVRLAFTAKLDGMRDIWIAACNVKMGQELSEVERNSWSDYKNSVVNIHNQDNYPEGVILPIPPSEVNI